MYSVPVQSWYKHCNGMRYSVELLFNLSDHIGLPYGYRCTSYYSKGIRSLRLTFVCVHGASEKFATLYMYHCTGTSAQGGDPEARV